MSATIMMPSTFDQAIREMCSEAVNQAVTALAAKHGFDAEEAMRDLGVGEIKLVRKRGPSPKSEKKKATDKPKTKRGTTGYIEYSKVERPAAKEHLLSELAEGVKLSPQDTVRELGARWKALSKEEQTVWVDKAKQINSAATSEASSPAESDDEAPKEEKKEKKAKPDDEEPKEKKERKKSGYFKFAEEKRPGIKADLKKDLAEGEKLKGETLMKAVAAAWSALSKDEKAVWDEKAKKNDEE